MRLNSTSTLYPRSHRISLGICLVIGIAAITLRMSSLSLEHIPLLATAIYGIAVVAAAFLLSWAAEALQLDINPRMAIGILALIAVLPEYAVDFYCAWSAAKDPHYIQYAAANMTGSNRLLIGVGWPLLALVASLVYKRSRQPKGPAIELSSEHSIDLSVLMLATLWSLFIPLLGLLSIWHGVGFIAIFGFYLWRISHIPAVPVELEGVAITLGKLPKLTRRLVVISLLLLSCGVLIVASKPFTEGLIHSGSKFGIDRFLLIQWVAPLASEAPELLVAVIFALRGNARSGLSTLLSSKVNQWTLLVGTLPLIYSVSLGKIGALHLEARQIEEMLLTAAQSFLGIAVLSNGKLERWEAMVLFGLFIGQIAFPQSNVRYGMAIVYFLLGSILLIKNRRLLKNYLWAGWKKSNKTITGDVIN